MILLHPISLLLVIVCAISISRSEHKPHWARALTLAVLGAITMPAVWWYGLPMLIGWHLGGLGGYLYLYYILPANGLCAGFALGLPAFYHKRATVVAVGLLWLMLVCGIILEMLIMGNLTFFSGNLAD